MIRTLAKLEAAGMISPEDTELGRLAHFAGTARHTIGVELEVLPSAYKDTTAYHDQENSSHSQIRRVCRRDLAAYNFVVENDGQYEIITPRARHPLSLIVAAQGLTKTGWLPEIANGVVTSHVNIGSERPIDGGSPTEFKLIRMLRACEALGGSTPGRLWAPLKKCESHGSSLASYSWTQKGVGGVKLVSPVTPAPGTDFNWAHSPTRIEFRTVRYSNIEQYGTTLESLYYLTRGLLSGERTSAFAIYQKFDNELVSYQERNDLPDLEDHYDITNIDTPDGFRAYMKPYVEHHGSAELSRLRELRDRAVHQLRESFDMSHLPTSLEAETTNPALNSMLMGQN